MERFLLKKIIRSLQNSIPEPNEKRIIGKIVMAKSIHTETFKMKTRFLFIILSINFSLSAQKDIDKEIVKGFEQTKQDSIFLSKYSDVPYQIEMGMYNNMRTDTISDVLYNDLIQGSVGHVYGPFQNETSVFYIKIIQSKSTYKTHVGNIWIDIKKGREKANKQATEIYESIKKGKSFDTACKAYSDDKNNQQDCDLGWVDNTSFVEPFATEITKHKKGEVYVVETSFGFHVVKALDDPNMDSQVVQYIKLVKNK